MFARGRLLPRVHPRGHLQFGDDILNGRAQAPQDAVMNNTNPLHFKEEDRLDLPQAQRLGIRQMSRNHDARNETLLTVQKRHFESDRETRQVTLGAHNTGGI